MRGLLFNRKLLFLRTHGSLFNKGLCALKSKFIKMGIYFESFLTDLVFAFVIFISTIYVYLKYNFQHWTRNNIAQLNPSVPFGDTQELLLKTESLGTKFEKIYNEFKALKVPVGGFYFTYRPELMLLDLDLIKKVLVKDFHHFVGRGSFTNEEYDPLTAHLFSLDGQKWKNLRVKLTPTFTSRKMKMMFNTLVATSDELKNILNENSKRGEPLDIKDILARFTTDVIGSCAFGLDCNSLKDPNTDFRKYGVQIFEPVKLIDKFRALGASLFPNVYKFFKIKVINNDVSNFFISVVKQTVQYREEKNIYRKDFMQLLIQLKNEETALTDDESTTNTNGTTHDKKGLTIEQISAQCFVFFLAGFETSSTTMMFCLYELVKNIEIQEKLREEIVSVLKKYDNKVCYDAVMEMHYMEKCINETLRKYPPLAFLIRKCNEDYPLPNSNYIIRKGDIIRISVLGIQRDPEIYPDPEKFDPERFSEAEKAKRHPMTYMPFGEGPRICIGMRFGLMQTKVGLTVLLKNYKFTLNKKTLEPFVMDPNNFILSPKGGVWLDAQKVTS